MSRYPTFRPGVIYGIRTQHPRWRWVRTRYVGQTRQRPWAKRIEQHRDDQPWGDLIVEAYVIYDSLRVSDFGLTLRERLHILLRFPSYNVTYNTRNPWRVPRREAQRERLKRERCGGARRAAGVLRQVVGTAVLLVGVLVLLAVAMAAL